MYNGPKGPVSGRTPRTLAEAATALSEFPAELSYHTQGGYPVTPAMGKTEFTPNVTGPGVVPSANPHSGSAPFTLK